MEKEKVYAVWHFVKGKGLLMKLFKHEHKKEAEQYIKDVIKECPEYWEHEELEIREEELC